MSNDILYHCGGLGAACQVTEEAMLSDIEMDVRSLGDLDMDDLHFISHSWSDHPDEKPGVVHMPLPSSHRFGWFVPS